MTKTVTLQHVDWDAIGVVTPYGYNNYEMFSDNGKLLPDDVSEKQWNNYSWNPPEMLTSRNPRHEGEDTAPDPDASPKPDWETIVKGNRLYELGQIKLVEPYALQHTGSHRAAITDAATIEHEGESLYVGAGLDHMTGLLQMVEQANDAGEVTPHVVMRDGDHQVKRLWRGSQVREVLKTTAARENAVESAHNIVMAEYHEQAKIRDDETQSLDDRETAAAAAQAILDDYPAKLKERTGSGSVSIRPGRDMPVDEHKKYHAEYLEAVALGKMKSLMGYTTNQGMMLHPSCFDQGAAAEQVASKLHEGLIAMNRQNNYVQVVGLSQYYEGKINEIEVLNTPFFRVNQLEPSDDPYPLDKLLVAADHPPTANVPGDVDILEIKVTKGKMKAGFPKFHTTQGESKHEAEIQIDPTQEARIVVRARNLCGVSRLVINMKPV